MECGVWSPEFGAGSAAPGVWRLERGEWSESEVWRAQWSLKCGLWRVECGLWSLK